VRGIICLCHTSAGNTPAWAREVRQTVVVCCQNNDDPFCGKVHPLLSTARPPARAAHSLGVRYCAASLRAHPSAH